MKTIVISIGGSVILSRDLDLSFFRKLASLFNKVSEQNKLFIVVGGGNIARRYIKLGRELGFDEKNLDSIGIDVTRINAKFLANTMGDNNPNIPISINEAVEINKPIVIMGGTSPGHSTDLVGAELAEKTSSDLYIIATNVDGVFNKDPNKYTDVKMIGSIKIDDLITDFGTEWKQAGKNIVIDGPALKVIKDKKINTCVLNGKKLDRLENALNFKPFKGTKILV